MSKEKLIDRHAQTLKSWVGTGLAKDECIGLIKNAVDEALFLYGVSQQRELLSRFIKQYNQSELTLSDEIDIDLFLNGNKPT